MTMAIYLFWLLGAVILGWMTKLNWAKYHEPVSVDGYHPHQENSIELSVSYAPRVWEVGFSK